MSDYATYPRHSAQEPIATSFVAPQSTPARWHPDPSGLVALRWWDGTNWTDRLAPFPTPLPPTFHPVMTSTTRTDGMADAPKPDSTRRGTIIIVAIVAAVSVAIAGVVLVRSHLRSLRDNSAALSDARNLVSVLEQCNSDDGDYPSAVSPNGTFYGCGQTIKLHPGSAVAYYPDTISNATNYILAVTNTARSSGKTFCYASVAGGAVTTISAPVDAYSNSC